MRLSLTTASLFVASLIVGCDQPASPAGGCCTEPAVASCASGPEAVAERFLEAARAADRDALTALVTPGAADAFRDGYELDTERLGACDLGSASIDGNDASIALVCADDDGQPSVDLLLRKGDDWRVRGLRARLGGQPVEVDFEELAGLAEQMAESLAEGIGQEMQQAFDDAQRTWEQGGTPEEIAARRARFEALTAVTLDEVDRSWRVDVDAAGRSLCDVVTELVEDTGLAVADDAPAEPVELRLDSVSRVEAIERVASAAGFHVVWPAPRPAFDPAGEPEPLRFEPGPRPLPATCVGPFLVEVVELEERVPHAVGSLELTVRALGLAPEVLAFQTESNEILAVERLLGDGRPLTDVAVHVWSSPTVREGYFVYSIDRDLVGLLHSVEAIDELSGEIRLPVPARVEALSLRRGTGPWTCQAGALDASSWSNDVELELAAPCAAGDDSFAATKLRMSPLDASGAALGVRFESSSGWGRKLTGNLQCPEPPAAIDVKVCTVETWTVPFELGPIALEQHARQPERLVELAFEGGEPLDVEILTHERSEHGDQVTLRATNRSNKDAVAVVVDFDYLDANGTKLDDFMHSLSGDWDFDSETFGPFVSAGATHETQTHAAFVPAGTVKILARLRSVEFPDGTSWERTVGAR